jgi:hypothetical protein
MSITFATINTISSLSSQNVDFKVLTDIDGISDPSFETKIEIDFQYENLIKSLNGFISTMNINSDVVDSYFKIWSKNKDIDSAELDKLVRIENGFEA